MSDTKKTQVSSTELTRYKYSKIAAFFKLDDVTSRHFLKIISNSFDYSSQENASKYNFRTMFVDEKFLNDLLNNFGHWHEFLFFLGTYICEIDNVEFLRVICGWALIALAYIERKSNPNDNKKILEMRDLQVYDVVHKIFLYVCRQHGTPNIRYFLHIFGEDFFDQIVGLLTVDPSFTVSNFTAFLTALAICTLDLQFDNIQDDQNMKNWMSNRKYLLNGFFTEYNDHILPRLVFTIDNLQTAFSIISRIVEILETEKEELFKQNFVYILDYYLRKAPAGLKLDVVLRTYDLKRADYFYGQKSTTSMLVAIFNLSTNETTSMTVIEQIAKIYDQNYQQWMASNFLGILVNIRHYLLCKKYFMRRKKEFAAGFAILLGKLNLELLQRFCAKIFQMLWLTNTEIENFKECWLVLLQKLDSKTLLKFVYRILFYISQVQLDNFREIAHALLAKISDLKADPQTSKNIMAILKHCYGIGSKADLTRVSKAGLIAIDNSPHLTYDILPKIFTYLNKSSTSLDEKLELIDKLLPLVDRLKCVEEVSVVGSCLGHIGAISPVYLSSAQASTVNEEKLMKTEIGPYYLYNDEQFLNEFVRKCLSWFSNNDNSTQSDMIGYSLQCIAHEVEKLPEAMQKMLEGDLKQELLPFLTSTFLLNRTNTSKQMPLITDVNSHDEWVMEWFCTISNFIKRPPFKLLHCLTQAHVGETSTIFSDFLPLVLLACLNELQSEPEKVDQFIKSEMIAVFSSVGHRIDIKDSCQFIFSFFGSVEKQLDVLLNSKNLPPAVVYGLKNLNSRFIALKQSVIEHKIDENDKFPCSATAAIACSNYYSALEILEKHVVKKDLSGITIFDRELFSLLQRLYYNVNDVENTQGAYLHIINNSVPSASETILNCEISGNVSDILPMLANSEENRESMSRCVLRLNQPELALAYVKHKFPDISLDQMRCQFPNAFAVFSNCAMELSNWELIEDQIENVHALSQWEPFNDPLPAVASETVQTFPSHLFMILANCRQSHFDCARQYFDLAQVCVTRSLSKTNAEGDRPYAVGFEFVQQLHSLADLQMAWPQLNIFTDSKSSQSDPVVNLDDLMSKWEKHDEFVSFNYREMEPILNVRRHILKSLDLPEQQLKLGLTSLLVKSCKLARNDELHYMVLPYLTEALKNGVSNIDIEEQRALYYSESLESNKRLHSIPTLNNAIAQFFPLCSQALQLRIDSITARPTLSTADTFKTIKGREDCDRFLKSSLLLLEMAQNQRETCVNQILNMYRGLETMNARSELFFYRYANCVDVSFKTHTEQSVRLLIKLCVEALKLGDEHVHELIPKIITTWLDVKPELIPSSPDLPVIAKVNEDATKLVTDAFQLLPHKTFFKAFPLLVSRLGKQKKGNKRVYDAIKQIMTDLICEFPHQCLLLSIAEFRSTDSSHKFRVDAIKEVYEAVRIKMPEFGAIFAAYEFVARSFMDLAGKKTSDRSIDLSIRFSNLLKFFEAKATPLNKVKGTLLGNVPARIDLPLFFAYLDNPFGKNVPDHAVKIFKLEKEAKVMVSLAAPKCIKFLGSDGNYYSVLCKPDDELRKDARFMDLARLLNTRCTANHQTRNLGIRIRTFYVIPLQEKGGIIEWVENMTTYSDFVSNSNLINTKEVLDLRSEIGKKNIPSIKMIDAYRKLVALYPLMMAESLRKLSTGPASYYQIQRRYTSSIAFMSSVGFIVGLGDRHIGNILIDQGTGEAMHVDFALLFNTGEKLNVPEKVPFRLTRNVVDGFGPIGIEGRFRSVMERSMNFMQQEKTAALTCLKGLLYDPLLEWQSTDDKKKSSDKDLNFRIQLVESRLSGYIHTLLKQKTGPFTVRGLVAQTIEIAMDEKTLAEMFVGWAAYI